MKRIVDEILNFKLKFELKHALDRLINVRASLSVCYIFRDISQRGAADRTTLRLILTIQQRDLNTVNVVNAIHIQNFHIGDNRSLIKKL